MPKIKMLKWLMPTELALWFEWIKCLTKDPNVYGSSLTGVKCFAFLRKIVSFKITKYRNLNVSYLDKALNRQARSFSSDHRRFIG